LITSVVLRGWRSHRESKFKFSEGTNVLIGVMGAGKSSLLDAISFALFGTFPALNSRKLTLEDIIMNRPKKENVAEVEVSFQINGDTYTVFRRIERGKGTTKSEIRKNGELLDSGTTKTTDMVERILKINYDLYSRAVYSEQNGLDYFLTVPKGQRMKKMDDLLQIDKFEKARSSTTSLINRIRESVSDKSRIVSEMEGREDFGRADSIKKEIEEIRKEQGELKKTLEEVEKEREKIENELKKFENKRKLLDDLKKKKNILSGMIRSLSGELESYKDVGTVSDIEIKIKEINETINSKKEELSSLEDEMKELTEEMQKIKVSIEDLTNRIDNLRTAEGKCPVCGSPLTKEHKEKLITERKNKISDYEVKLSRIEEDVSALEKKIDEVKNEIESYRDKKLEFERMREKIKDAEEKKKKLNEYKKEELEIGEKISREMEGFNEDVVNGLQEKLREVLGKITEVRVRSESNEKFLKDKEGQLLELEEKKKMFKKYKEQIGKMKVLIEELKKFEKALKETQITLRSEFVEAVNATMDRIWEYLYPYDDYTSIRLSIQKGDYVLELRESGGTWVSVDGIASGGERTTVCLALRIAFALVLAPSLKWLVLDEPTHNLDSQAVDYLATVLREKISEFIEQVFLITHDEKLENAVTGYLYRLERKKEKNEPTKVVLLASPKD